MTAVPKMKISPSEVVSDPSVMSGDPVVRGTRVPAMTVVAYLREGHSRRDIFENYPTLPLDGIDAVIAWADATLGEGWRAGAPAADDETALH